MPQMLPPPQIERGQCQSWHVNGGFDEEPIMVPHQLRPDGDQIEQKTRQRQPQQRGRGDETGKDYEPGKIPGIVRRQEKDKGAGEEGGGGKDIPLGARPPEGDVSRQPGQETRGGGETSHDRRSALGSVWIYGFRAPASPAPE